MRRNRLARDRVATEGRERCGARVGDGAFGLPATRGLLLLHPLPLEVSLLGFVVVLFILFVFVFISFIADPFLLA